jgi:hypothetical protein
MFRDAIQSVCDLFVVVILVVLVVGMAGAFSHYRPLPPLLESGVTAHLTPPISQ